MKKWAIRTIKNGTVKINGHKYKPEERHLKYDGRLDGMRYVFGLYFTAGKMEPYVSLWGSEDIYLHSLEGNLHTGPEVVNGTLPWMFWKKIE